MVYPLFPNSGIDTRYIAALHCPSSGELSYNKPLPQKVMGVLAGPRESRQPRVELMERRADKPVSPLALSGKGAMIQSGKELHSRVSILYP